MAPPPVNILILRTGHTHPDLIRSHGDYDRWFTDRMARMGCRFTTHHVPTSGVPAGAGRDGVLVTGTAASVLEEEDWMLPLMAFFRGLSGEGPPVLAVCFGAQLAARALGGSVERNPRGWEIGTVEVRVNPAGRDDPLFTGLGERIHVQATHEDHIAALPEGARRLAGNDMTPVQAFAHGERLHAVQFHPEAGAGLLRRLVHLRRPVLEEDLRRRQGLGGKGAGQAVDRIARAIHSTENGRHLLRNWLTACVRNGPPGPR
ncbi:MAG: type 1 glutamine amidotransferase [Acidobacteriota bacterium]